jgi:hypothetical protein
MRKRRVGQIEKPTDGSQIGNDRKLTTTSESEQYR